MITALVTVVMFLVMVSLHEFGHFIVAKALNFKILEYAIGFGPAIFKKQKGETLYAVRAIPLGGFCKFEGEEELSADPRAFSNQAVWKRILVIVAGGISNVILGFILFLIILPSTSPVRTNIIERVVPHSYLEQMNVKSGDRIVEINGKKVNFYNDIALYTQDFTKDTSVEIKIKRDGKKSSLNFKPTEQKIDIKYTDKDIEYISTINGYSETEHIEYSNEYPKDESKVGTEENSVRYILGFTPKSEDITVLNVWGQAWNNTRFVVKLVYQSLWDLVTGKARMEQMSGPVGIVKEVNTAVNQGNRSWLYVLNLIALITINLGVFNLLPFPALDGGRLFFMLIELIRRKPIPPEKEGTIHAIGMLLLLLLVVFVSYHDIIKLFN